MPLTHSSAAATTASTAHPYASRLRCCTASNSTTAAATDTFRLATCPRMGMDARRSQDSRTRSRRLWLCLAGRYLGKTLVPLIAQAPADATTRATWLDRLFETHGEDQIPYIESLADHWGELCASKAVASQWADRLLDITRLALTPEPGGRGHFHGTTACLSALYTAERYDDLHALLAAENFWPYRRWTVRALAAQGKNAEAVQLAEASRSPWASDWDIDRLCEEILLSSGVVDDGTPAMD